MKIGTTTLLATLAVQAATASETQLAHVTVCMDRGTEATVVEQAQAMSSKMFASAGVSIDWHGVRGCPSQAIVVGMNSAAPATSNPGALACSQLFEGIHIVVLYNRIEHRAGEGPVAPVLAHVLVHEITHMLQGLDRHSASGIMKATWRFADFRQMGVRPLPFTADDIELIRLGLEKRACQPAEIRSEGVLVAAR